MSDIPDCIGEGDDFCHRDPAREAPYLFKYGAIGGYPLGLTAALGSALSGRIRSLAETAGTSILKSMRSSSGPEMRA